MLIQSSPIVCDAGRTLNQHWFTNCLVFYGSLLSPVYELYGDHPGPQHVGDFIPGHVQHVTMSEECPRKVEAQGERLLLGWRVELDHGAGDPSFPDPEVAHAVHLGCEILSSLPETAVNEYIDIVCIHVLRVYVILLQSIKLFLGE